MIDRFIHLNLYSFFSWHRTRFNDGLRMDQSKRRYRRKRYMLVFATVWLLTSCEQYPHLKNITPTAQKDSAPLRPMDVSLVSDAIPKYEPRTKAGNKSPYKVMGKVYHVLEDPTGYSNVGYASWYGVKFQGRPTANGEIYDMYSMTAAHVSLPIPSYVRVTNLENGRQVVVRVNDRGPFHPGREIDLSYAGADKLGYLEKGTAKVRVDYLPMPPEPVESRIVFDSKAINRVNEPPLKHTASQRDVVLESSVSEEADLLNRHKVYFQVGAFRERESARKIQQKVSEKTTFAVNIVEDLGLGEILLYKIHIGPLPDEHNRAQLKLVLDHLEMSSPLLIYK